MASQLVLLLSLLVIGVAFYSKPANANQMVIKLPDYKHPELKNAILERQINSANITRSSGVPSFQNQNLHNPLVGKDVKEKNEITDITGKMSMQNQDAEKFNVSIGEAFYSKSASEHQHVSGLYKADYKLPKFPNSLFGWPINSRNTTRSSGVANSTILNLHSPLVGKDEKTKNESNVTTRNISMENFDGEPTNIANSQPSETPQLQMKKKMPTVIIIIVAVSSSGLLFLLTIFLINNFYDLWLFCNKRSDSTSRPEPAVAFQNGFVDVIRNPLRKKFIGGPPAKRPPKQSLRLACMMASDPNMVDPAVARDEDSPNREQREMDERRKQMTAQLQQDVMEVTTVLGRLGRTLMQAAPFDFAVRNEGRGNPEANAEGSDASPAGNGGTGKDVSTLTYDELPFALLVFGSAIKILHFFSFASILFLGYHNISGTLTCIPSTILEDVSCNKSSIYFAPENVQALEIIFEAATAYNITIKYGYFNFNHFEYDKISGYARVGAGHSLFNLTQKLHSLGRGLLCIPPQADVTVGAAILNGDHCSSLKYPTKFSRQIVGQVHLNKFGKLKNFTVCEIAKIVVSMKNIFYNNNLLGLLWKNPEEFLNLVKTYAFFELTSFPGSKEILGSTSEVTEIDVPGNCKKHWSLDFTFQELVCINAMLKARQNSVLDVGMLFAQLNELKSMYQLEHTGSKVLCSPSVGYGHKMLMTQKENHTENNLHNPQEFCVTITQNQLGDALITVKEGLQGYPEANYETGINFQYFGDFNKF
ncbi:unnamed protein product [Orchesella dallaii]|uniref:Uncharacterized protein n=1 Tax=Orchesella dallaii TaxID=48710 RepID=A0ABP1RP49_9HEXA